MRILAINAGSSSLKTSLVDDGVAIGRSTLEWTGNDRAATLHSVFRVLGSAPDDIDAVAHRVVHGGTDLTASVVIDDGVVRAIAEVGELAPLHNDVALETIAAAREAIPHRPHVATFDTAFHAEMPEAAITYPVPMSWRSRWGIRQFGFHGLSVEWSVDRAGQLLGRDPAESGLVVAHLGSGCSVTAVWRGKSAWTSMGFTPLDGLMMRTRSGAIDPGIILHLLRHDRLDVEGLAAALEHESGLAGVGGGSGDVRELGAAADNGDGRARLALEMFAWHAAGAIAAAATALARVDAIVFTGGIGEHAAAVRAGIVERLGVLGIEPIEPTESGEDRILSRGKTSVLRIEAREDLVMARAASSLAGATPD